MSEALRVLFLAPQVPWPLDTGGKIRTFHIARTLAARHRVRMLAFGDRDAEAAGVDALRRLGIEAELFAPPAPWTKLARLGLGLLGPVPANVRKYQDARLRARVLQLTRQGAVDLIHCDHLHMSPYGPPSQVPFVVDEHNVECVIWDRFAADRTQPIPKRLAFYQQGFWLRRLELELCRRAALVLLCSSVDEEVLRRLSNGALGATQVVPNGVDVDYFSAPGPAEVSGHLVFTGSMDWAPNENAVLAFLGEIWPEMRREQPDSRFVVVGRNPSARLQARAREAGASVTGTVPDVRPYLRGALGLVVPMRVGGGTRLKILEAFAAGVPVISTALGIEGILATPGVHYLVAETAREFADAARQLAEQPALRQAIVARARQLARERYSWDAVGGALAGSYAERFRRR